jgi:hypothetical protein
MGRKKLSNAERARRFIAANPNAKPRDIAAALAIPVTTVYAAKYKTPVAKAKPKEVNIDAVHKHAVAEAEYKKAVAEAEAAKADMVNHPPHYKAGGIETIDFIEAKLTREEFIGYLKGNALKYASRIGKKGAPDIDAGKMAWYATKLRDVLNISQ